MKELVVISGKGGTGKTTLVASFAALSKNAVLADCDVDAADLHLVLEPKIRQEEQFVGGKKAQIITGACTDCGKCLEVCRYDAISNDGPPNHLVAQTCRIDPLACEGCKVCAHVCEDQAISFREVVDGQVFVSDTRWGKMVHARLNVGGENSGKLVTRVRTVARDLAEKNDRRLLIVDGSPGIGCPVIASLTGADLALVVTEPTRSGMHDLERVMQLTGFLKIPTVVCVNKWDINSEITDHIENQAGVSNIRSVGKISYDKTATAAQLMRSSVVEYTGGLIAQEISALWKNIIYELN